MTANFNPAGISAILMGDESLTIACGDMMLAGGHVVAAVATRDDAVRDWAEGQGISVVGNGRDLLASNVAADWLLSIANLRMIPDDVLALPAKGAINFHDGPLPRYAGLNTPAWAIINGEATHGVSWHLIEGGVDEGDLLAQKMVDIASDETAFSLNSKCYAAGMESFAVVLAQLEAGALDRVPQDLSQRSYFARDQRPEGMGVLDFGQSATTLSALVRGLDFGDYWNPLGTAKVILNGMVCRIGSLAIEAKVSGNPGTISAVSGATVTVGTATEDVTLLGLTDMQGQSIDAAQLVKVGDVLDQPNLPAFSVKDEAYWRAALKGADALGLTLATSGGLPADVKKLTLKTVVQGTDAERFSAAALVSLRNAGAAQGMIAFPAVTEHSLAASWLPLTVAATDNTSVSDFVTSLEPQLERMAGSDGMMLDLPLRDADISDSIQPIIGLNSSETLVEGTALSISVTKTASTLIYDANRISQNALAVLAARFEAAFAALPSAATCADVWAMPQSETQRLIADWNATETAYTPTTIHAAFEAQVARNPEDTALVFEGETLSYAALNARANQLAQVLRDMGGRSRNADRAVYVAQC